MKESISGSYVPGKSFLHRLDTKAKFFSFLLLLIHELSVVAYFTNTNSIIESNLHKI